MTFENDLMPWLELAQNWVYQFIYFLRNGAGYSTGYEMFRFVGLPVVWLYFFSHAMWQATTLHKYKKLSTKPAQPPELSPVSGILWLIPVWVALQWNTPTNGLYLFPVVAVLAHVCLWYSGMFRMRATPGHVYTAVGAMLISSYLMLGHINVPYKRGLPQEHLLQHRPTTETLTKMVMHRCFEEEGCSNKPDMASRVTAREMRLTASPISYFIISNRCSLVGHSPLGLFYCNNGESEYSLRELLGKAYPSLPSATADCHRVDWMHAPWQPNGFWPSNPPLSLLSAKEETVLNCATNEGLDGKPFMDGATPSSSGRYLLPAKHVLHHDWWALKLMFASDVVNARGVNSD